MRYAITALLTALLFTACGGADAASKVTGAYDVMIEMPGMPAEMQEQMKDKVTGTCTLLEDGTFEISRTTPAPTIRKMRQDSSS